MTLVGQLSAVRPVSPVWTVFTGDHSGLYVGMTHTGMKSGKGRFNVDVDVDVKVDVAVDVKVDIVVRASVTILLSVVLYLLLAH